MAEAALAVDDLSLVIGAARVVDSVGFAVAPGEVLALVGESGCGKSLTAQAVMRLLPDAIRQVSGRVRLAGDDISALPERRMRELRGRRVSMIFQEPQAALDPLATVGTQVAEALRLAPRDARQSVRKMLADVGIADPGRRIDQYPFELSGGMCQRVMIATALISGPAVLLADEPTTALDVTIQAQILELLRRLAIERHTAVVLITHDMGVVAETAHRVQVMYAGQMVEEQPTEALFRAPRHPYTAALLDALPERARGRARLPTIPGVVPGIDDRPSGCLFNPRCRFATELCTTTAPALLGPPGQRARCHYPLDDAGRPTGDHPSRVPA
jgi:oligopeptide/dipeptide ABC transporter ATP-binding protein